MARPEVRVHHERQPELGGLAQLLDDQGQGLAVDPGGDPPAGGGAAHGPGHLVGGRSRTLGETHAEQGLDGRRRRRAVDDPGRVQLGRLGVGATRDQTARPGERALQEVSHGSSAGRGRRSPGIAARP